LTARSGADYRRARVAATRPAPRPIDGIVTTTSPIHRLTSAVIAVAIAGTLYACGDGTGSARVAGADDPVLRWNAVALDASRLDHTPAGAAEQRAFGEQLGPTASARALAMIHIAMADAVAMIDGGFATFFQEERASPAASIDAAVAQAAHDTAVVLYPSQAATFDAALARALAAIPDSPAKTDGIAVGRAAAVTCLDARAGDGSELSAPGAPDDYVFGQEPGAWRVDPMHTEQTPLGPKWGRVKPFAMTSASQFRAPPPPALDSAEYAAAFNEVKALGGDGITTPTVRTPEQTLAGIYWGYDGQPGLCAPVVVYNQIVVQIARERDNSVVESARLLALVNVAMADAGIAAWETKYFYNFWRPVTGIREADPANGPSGAGDGNAATVGDPQWSPLGAPADNSGNTNFTPPFPAYVSGHATFGGAVFQTLRDFYGTDGIRFTFVSDEFNGVTRDQFGNIRPLVPRTFETLSQAEEENAQSRIYLGIHWSFDKVNGIRQGNEVADLVFATLFLPK
jgi:hypothetical protein